MKFGGLIGRIGPLLARRHGDTWHYGLRTGDEHGNPIGVIHGGTLMTLLDQTATLVAIWLTGEKAVMTVQLDTRFLAPAKVGELIEGEARLRHRTQSMLFLDAALSVDGRPVADASVIMKILPRSTKLVPKDG
ncbi:PaaI family thioesterase [Hydrocarboniphaga sp.]|uniref:PaaI family thioesterase n=1 Tax=Hydrocarboniphaga sp. TaxID=2033016 RepID=UPI0026219718|nr:PaaI family thioesterase [Hydrocarboniphaga sp.]